MQNQPKHLLHPKYRPDIDGLRAIAVLSVVMFHAFPDWVKGGFVGVDVFFVISGFLISTIIIENLQEDRFSFLEFYSRRIRRIFPALLLVLAACYAFGWFTLLANEFKHLGKHMAGGAGFVSNLLFWNESGYFDSASENKPLLHLWSLGIEEQFYVIWPLLLWVAYRRQVNLFTAIVVVTAISFMFNVIEVRSDAISAFYSPQTRFWELFVGALLAYEAMHPHALFQRFRQQLAAHEGLLRNAQSVSGALLIAAGFVLISKDRPFPGWWGMLPTLGTVLVIAAGMSAWINRKVLANRVLVWVGLISFPLYLWHWPLLSFLRIIEGGTPSVGIRVAAIITAIVLAWGTYVWIEKPLRFGEYAKVKTFALVTLMVISGTVGYMTYRVDGLGSRATIQNLEAMQAEMMEPVATRYSDGSCEQRLGLHLADGIVCLANSSSPEVLIVGDSHAMALNSAAYLGRYPLKTVMVAVHACLPFEKFTINDLGFNRECRNLGDMAEGVLNRYLSIKTVYVATRGPLYFTGKDFGIGRWSGLRIVPIEGDAVLPQEQMFYEGYLGFIAKLVASGREVIFVIDVPELNTDPRNCLFRRPFAVSNKGIVDCDVSKAVVLARQSAYRNWVQKIKDNIPVLKIYDSLNTFCDERKCHAKDAEHVWYFDSDHVSVSGSSRVLHDIMLIP